MRKRIPPFVFAVTPVAMFIMGMTTSDDAWALIVLGVLALIGIALEVVRYHIEHQH